MKLDRLVLASDNRGKYLEFKHLMESLKVELVLQKDFQVGAVAETGSTFVENALIKARHCALQTGLPSLADDSGLIVPALGGAPGLRSARYAGEKATDADNRKRLLKAMAACSGEQRRAFFHSTLVLLRSFDDPDPVLAQGRWFGRIALKAEGEGGFGYDPVFVCDQHSLTAAQLKLADKNIVSHRAQAWAAFCQALTKAGALR